MEQTRYVVNRLCIDGQPTDRVVLNQTGDEKEGRRYGRLIETKGPNFWQFVGLIVSDRKDLAKITEIGGASDEVVFKRTGVDVRSMIQRVGKR